MLNIEPIKNVYSGLELCLGDFNNDEKNRYWGYEFNKNLDLHIGKLERCRENLNKEPLKVELVDIFNDEYKYCFKDEKGNVYGFSNGGDCIFLTTLDKKGDVENRLYDFIDPILWDKNNIYSITNTTVEKVKSFIPKVLLYGLSIFIKDITVTIAITIKYIRLGIIVSLKITT